MKVMVVACHTAEPRGIHAADTLARLVKGRKPKPYSLGYLGLAVSLGRRGRRFPSWRQGCTAP